MAPKADKKEPLVSEEMEKAAAKLVAGEVTEFAAPSLDANLFEDSTTGELFGGNYPVISLDVGEVSPMLVYEKNSKITLESKQKKGVMEDHKTIIARVKGTDQRLSMPIGTVFTKQVKEADLQV